MNALISAVAQRSAQAAENNFESTIIYAGIGFLILGTVLVLLRRRARSRATPHGLHGNYGFDEDLAHELGFSDPFDESST